MTELQTTNHNLLTTIPNKKQALALPELSASFSPRLRRDSYLPKSKPFTYTSAQKYSFMQNKPNFPRFCAKNADSEEKQSQFKPNLKPPPANTRFMLTIEDFQINFSWIT